MAGRTARDGGNKGIGDADREGNTELQARQEFQDAQVIQASKASTASKTVKLTEDEIGELVLIALGDDELCDAIEEHERRLLALKGGRDPYAGTLHAPNMRMITQKIANLIDEHCENARNIDNRDLIFALRTAILDQMVLPDHILWGAVSDTRH